MTGQPEQLEIKNAHAQKAIVLFVSLMIVSWWQYMYLVN